MIPPRESWPVGFTTDFVTGAPDRPWLWCPDWRRPWTWLRLRRVDLREAAWWHDLRYFVGRAVSASLHPNQLRQLRPVSNLERTDYDREAIDAMLERDFIAAGVHPASARVAVRAVVALLGRPRFFWATRGELRRRLG